METRTIVSYIATDVSCMTLALIVLRRVSGDLGSEREVSSFRASLLSYVAFLVFDLIYFISGDASIVSLPPAISIIAVCLSLTFPGLLAFFWYWFVSLRLNKMMTERKDFRLLSLVPLVVGSFLATTTPWTGLVEKFFPSGIAMRGPLFWLQGAICGIYGIAAVWQCLRSARAELQQDVREADMMLALVVIFPAVAGIIDVFVPGSAILAPGYFASVFFAFSGMRVSCVYTDSLTGLNNRKRLQEYYSEYCELADAKGQIVVCIVDVDRFKQINDRRGHLAGDRALVAVAQALASCVGRHRGFVARYGGDEFVLLFPPTGAPTAEELAEELADDLVEARVSVGVGFRLELSVGLAWGNVRTEDLAQVLERADAELYEVKKKHHRQETR